MAFLLFDIGVIIIFATLLSYAARLLKQPMIVAYVIAGVIIGPSVLGLITGPQEIATLAELGIAFLLFTVGLEIDFNKLRTVGKATLLGGLLQIAITYAVGWILAGFLGFGYIESVYIGLLVAFSSTMIVTKILIDRNEVRSLQGRVMIGILILQDIAVIILLPLLTNLTGTFTINMIADVAIKGLGLFAIAVVLNRFMLPRVLDYAAREREVLFLTAITIVFVFIGFSSLLGFSIVIGAFIAGIALGGFPYNLEIVGETRALMEFFSIIFFTSLGMSLSFAVIYSMLVPFLVLLAIVLIIKPVILGFFYLVMGYGSRTSSAIGLGLAQASEFSFIMAAQGLAFGHISSDMYSLLVSVVVISMLLTPYFIKEQRQFQKVFLAVKKSGFGKRVIRKNKVMQHMQKSLANHTIIFGCDMMGTPVLNYLLKKKRPVIVVDHDPEIVRKLKLRGVNCIYGNADNEDLLKRLNLGKARLVIITIPNYESSAFVVEKVKRTGKKARIVARAENEDYANKLKKSGVKIIIMPESIGGERIVREVSRIL